MLPSTLSAQSYAPEVHKQRVLEFLKEWTDPERGKLRCQFFVLFHETENGREPVTTKEVSFKIAKDEDRASRCERCTAELVDAAVGLLDAASSTGRVQKFSVAGYSSTGVDASPWGQCPFQLQSTAPIMGGLSESEGATPHGALAQSMRLTDGFAHKLASSLDRSAERSDRMQERLMERCMQLEQLVMQYANQIQDLLDRSAERALNVHKGRLSIEREERLYRALEVYGMQWLNKATGGEANPIVGFLKGLNQEQMMGMLAVLPDEKKRELYEIMKSYSAASGESASAPIPQMGAVQVRPKANGAA